MKPQPYHNAIKNSNDWQLPWERPCYEDIYSGFVRACMSTFDFAPSLVRSLWFYRRGIRTWWRHAPTNTPFVDKAAHRLAYFALLHGLSEEHTHAILKAWHFQHGVEIDDERNDELSELVNVKANFGKASKSFKRRKQRRKENEGQRKRNSRNQQRELKGVKKRISRQSIFEVLPVASNGYENELDMFTYNATRPRTIDDIVNALGIFTDSAGAVNKHLSRLSANGHIFKNASGVWYRPRSEYDYITLDGNLESRIVVSSSRHWYKGTSRKP